MTTESSVRSTPTTAAVPAAATAVPIRRRRTRRARRQQATVHIVLSLVAAAGLFPFFFLVVSSLKTTRQFYDSYWQPTWPPQLGNYTRAWNQVRPYLLTSVEVAASAIVGTLLLATTAGFVISRYRFIGRQAVFVGIALLLMVPSISTLVPLFIMMRDLHLLNTLTVLIIPAVAGPTVLAIVLVKNYTDGIPQELFDAARADGAGGVRMFTHVLLPLSKPIIGTVTLVTVVAVWDEFFWPLLTVTDNNLRTIGVGVSFFQGQNTTNWGPLFAGYILASLPLLLVFALLSRYLLSGVQGGISGTDK